MSRADDRPRRPSGPSVAPTGTTAYVVDVGGRSTTVEIGPEGARIDGALVPAELVELAGSPIRLLRLGDDVYEVIAHSGERRGVFTLTLRDTQVSVEATDERMRVVRSVAAAAGSHQGPEPVRAPMPGLIVRVLVAPGNRVRAGDPVVVIEAMKMENELRAKTAGLVRTVSATQGTVVEKGALLIEFN